MVIGRSPAAGGLVVSPAPHESNRDSRQHVISTEFTSMRGRHLL